MFTNSQVSVDLLPNVSDVQWQRLHPPFVRQQQLIHAAFALAALIGWVVFRPFAALPLSLWSVLIAGASVAGVLYLLWPTIDFPRRGYALREHDMIHKHGVLFRAVTAVPFNRIQHVEISNSPLDRVFGIGSLKLFTAGGSGGDLSIDGLPLARAEALREHILGKVGVTVERD
ncbi:MAG: PH domain-containing protein [Gammaproteobacteria bacterium]